MRTTIIAALAGLAAWSALGVGSAESRTSVASQAMPSGARESGAAQEGGPRIGSRTAVMDVPASGSADYSGTTLVVALDAATSMPIAGGSTCRLVMVTPANGVMPQRACRVSAALL